MSSISSVSSTANPYQNMAQSGVSQLVQDFNSIGSALQSGNLTTAQSALQSFQQALQGNSQTQASQPFGTNSRANSDFQNLAGALKSGDLSAAQKDFASLQNDLKSTQSAHRGHRHHHHSSSTPSSTASSPSTVGSTSNNPSTNSGGGLNVTA